MTSIPGCDLQAELYGKVFCEQTLNSQAVIPSRLVSSGVQSHFLVCDCDTLWLDPKCPQNSPKVLIPWHPGRGHCLILCTVYSLVSSHSSVYCFLGVFSDKYLVVNPYIWVF